MLPGETSVLWSWIQSYVYRPHVIIDTINLNVWNHLLYSKTKLNCLKLVRCCSMLGKKPLMMEWRGIRMTTESEGWTTGWVETCPLKVNMTHQDSIRSYVFHYIHFKKQQINQKTTIQSWTSCKPSIQSVLVQGSSERGC